MKQPIPFVVFDKSEQCVVKEEALQLLNQVSTNQVAIISIAGLYRTGKSFILNQLAQQQTGFDIGASVEPCTEGLWMWIIEPDVLAKYSLPSNLTVVLLDTEGLGSYTKSQTHDTRIFSLALLLSSFFVYNSLGTIDDNAIDSLSLVVHISENIKASVDANSQDATPLSNFFPKFLWLLRDFSLELRMDGKEITPNQYLENSLKPFVNRNDPDAASKDEVRACIKKYFPDRACFTLKRPVKDEEQLQELATLPLSEFREEYLQEVDKMIKYIYNRVTPKTLFGVNLNGPMLAQLTLSYVKAMNSGSVPNIQSAWENVVEMQCREAVASARNLYESSMKTAFQAKHVMEDDELKQLHQQLESKASGIFYARAVGDDTHRYLVELQTFITTTYEKLERDNRSNSKALCEKILTDGLAQIQRQVADGAVNTLDALQDALKKFQRVYHAEALGPAKMSVYFSSEIGPRIVESARLLSDRMLESAQEKARKELEAEREKTAKEYSTLQDLYRSVDTELKKEETKSKALWEENKDLKFEAADLKKQIKTLNGDIRKLKEATVELDEKNKSLNNMLEEYKRRDGPNAGSSSNGNQDDVEKLRAENADLKQRLERKKKRCTIM